jgi:CRP-like cAMP-binding protein
MRLDKKSMMEILHEEPEFSNLFVAYLLKRNIQYEEELVDQLFNPTEKRLARTLLMLARFGKKDKKDRALAVPRLSQATLAAMVGTTRGRASFFMNRFRKLGFIDYRAGKVLQVNHLLLSVVLQD